MNDIQEACGRGHTKTHIYRALNQLHELMDKEHEKKQENKD